MLNPKNQNNTLTKTKINYGLSISLQEGDGIPLAFLHCIDATSTSWVCHCVKTQWLANATSITSTTNTSLMVLRILKQITQYIAYEFQNMEST